MNRTKLLLLIAILAIVILLIIYGIHVLAPSSSTSHIGTSSPNFPIDGGSQGIQSATTTLITIPIQNNQQLATKNFLINGVTIPDPENKGRYLLAGNLGYCLPNTKCTAAQTPEFNIFYDANTSTFTIGLLTEPLSKARQDAEIFLENSLGVQGDSLCALKYYIGTTYTVNQNYAGGSLGFSMCPGAVQLP